MGQIAGFFESRSETLAIYKTYPLDRSISPVPVNLQWAFID